MWHQCLEVLRDEFPAQQFNTWLRPLQSDHREGHLMLFAPNRFVMDWVNEKYLRRIQEVVKEQNGGQAPRVGMKVGSAPREGEPVMRSELVQQGSARRVQDESGGRVTEEEQGIAATVGNNRPAQRNGYGFGTGRRPVQVEGDIKPVSYTHLTLPTIY